jgi:hypothetical protein
MAYHLFSEKTGTFSLHCIFYHACKGKRLFRLAFLVKIGDISQQNKADGKPNFTSIQNQIFCSKNAFFSFLH